MMSSSSLWADDIKIYSGSFCKLQEVLDLSDRMDFGIFPIDLADHNFAYRNELIWGFKIKSEIFPSQEDKKLILDFINDKTKNEADAPIWQTREILVIIDEKIYCLGLFGDDDSNPGTNIFVSIWNMEKIYDFYILSKEPDGKSFDDKKMRDIINKIIK